MNSDFPIFDDPAQRIAKDWAFAKTQVAAWRAAGETVVFTNGVFDLLHPGHMTYLAQARMFGHRLVVGLNSDASVKRLKGETRPLQAEEDRAFNLAALRSVDLVVPFTEDTPLDLIQTLHPDVLVKGGDYSIATIVGAQEVLAWGGKVEVLSFVQGKSTTSLIEKMG
ncbi:MAG: D-glycero-beta-D-manno-heptose 1-phosphate adenylyltransferase [Saprospiraceae bacterium]